MLRRTALSIAAAVTLALAAPASAQKAGPNGGVVYSKAGHDAELVIAPAELTVFLSHEGKPEGTKGVSLKAVIQQGGGNASIAFADVDGKKLVAKLGAPLAPGAIVVVTGKDHHGDVISLRHVVK